MAGFYYTRVSTESSESHCKSTTYSREVSYPYRSKPLNASALQFTVCIARNDFRLLPSSKSVQAFRFSNKIFSPTKYKVFVQTPLVFLSSKLNTPEDF